jgi:hypothetical protein
MGSTPIPLPQQKTSILCGNLAGVQLKKGFEIIHQTKHISKTKEFDPNAVRYLHTVIKRNNEARLSAEPPI